MKKKHELLKYAYDNYPKGAIISNEFGNATCSGEYKFSSQDGAYSNAIHDVKTSAFIFNPNRSVKWAEIVDKKPILFSEDGKDLFEGDKFWNVIHQDKKEWVLFNTLAKDNSGTVKDTFKKRDNVKSFSTKEAAEKWIEGNNNPINGAAFKIFAVFCILSIAYFIFR